MIRAMCQSFGVVPIEEMTTKFKGIKLYLTLRKRTLIPVRLVLEDSSQRSFMLFVVVSLQLGSII